MTDQEARQKMYSKKKCVDCDAPASFLDPDGAWRCDEHHRVTVTDGA